MQQLFAAKTANGNSSVIKWQGGDGMLLAEGTWDGATVAVQISPDQGTTWQSITSASLTANGTYVFRAPACHMRLNISGVGAGTTLDSWVAGIEVA